MKGWEVKTLGEAVTLEYGKPLPQEDRDPNGENPAYGANGILCRTNKHYHDRPSFIVGRKGSAGEINLTAPKFWPLDVTYFVTFDEHKYDLMFLYHAFHFLDLPSLAKGVKPGINRNDVYALSFAFPPLDEQRRIVAILDETFAGLAVMRQHAEANLKNARALFDSQLNAMFSQRGEGWLETTLGAIADFKNGLNYTQTSKGEVIRIVGVKDFQNHFWMPVDGLDEVQIDGALPPSYELQDDDILTVRSNGNKQLIGRCILARGVPGKASHSGFTIRIRVTDRRVNPIFLTRYLKSDLIRQTLIESGDGANISSLNQKALTVLPVSFPELATQQGIIAELEEVEANAAKLESLYRQKLAAIKELKQSILHRAFSGALSAKDALAA